MKQEAIFSRIGLSVAFAIVIALIGFCAGTTSVSSPDASDVPTPTPRTPTPATPTFTPVPPTSTPVPTPTFTPTPTPTPTGWFTPGPISSVGKLITAEQTFQAAQYYENRPPWCLFFDICKNKFTIVAYGTIQAGVDLRKLGDKDFVLNNGTIIITLPPPEIFGKPNLDLDKTFVIDAGLNPIPVNELLLSRMSVYSLSA